MRYVLSERKMVRKPAVYDVVVSRTPDFSRNTVELVFSDGFECSFQIIARIKDEAVARGLAKKLYDIVKN